MRNFSGIYVNLNKWRSLRKMMSWCVSAHCIENRFSPHELMSIRAIQREEPCINIRDICKLDYLLYSERICCCILDDSSHFVRLRERHQQRGGQPSRNNSKHTWHIDTCLFGWVESRLTFFKSEDKKKSGCQCRCAEHPAHNATWHFSHSAYHKAALEHRLIEL